MAARYLTLSWDEFHRDARRLANLAAKHGPYQGIVAVSRGGLIPAAILAHVLNIRLIECVSVAVYDQANTGPEETLTEPAIIKPPSAAAHGDGFLIVDDLVDTGIPASVIRGLLPKARFACVYAKPAAVLLPTMW